MTTYKDFTESIPVADARKIAARIAILLGAHIEWNSAADFLERIADIVDTNLPDTVPQVGDQTPTVHRYWALLAREIGYESDYETPEVNPDLGELILAAAEAWSGGDIPNDWRTTEYGRGQIELILNAYTPLLPGEIVADGTDAESRKDFVWLLIVDEATK